MSSYVRVVCMEIISQVRTLPRWYEGEKGKCLNTVCVKTLWN